MKKNFLTALTLIALTSLLFISCGQKKDNSALLKPDSLNAVGDMQKKYAESVQGQQSLETKELKVNRIVEGGGAAPATGTAAPTTSAKGGDQPADEAQVSQRIENQVNQVVEAAQKRTGSNGFVQFDIVVSPDGSVKSFVMRHNDLDKAAENSIRNTVMQFKYKSFDAAYGDFKPGTFKVTF